MVSARSDVTFLVAELAALSAALLTAFYTLAAVPPPPTVEWFVTGGPLIFVTIWVQKDHHRSGVGPVLDLGYFVLLAWPIVLPWYAFKTRGRSGWRLAGGLLALACAGYIAGFMLAYLTGRP